MIEEKKPDIVLMGIPGGIGEFDVLKKSKSFSPVPLMVTNTITSDTAVCCIYQQPMLTEEALEEIRHSDQRVVMRIRRRQRSHGKQNIAAFPVAVKYRVRGENGKMYGGPMYALERGLGLKWLAVLFAIFTALASFGIGCTVQANSIALLAHETFGVQTWIIGLVVCLLTASVILGGVKAIARVCTFLVPFMAVLYVLGCIIILCLNNAYVWPAIQLIVDSAFNPSAAGGGFLGASVMMAARYGIARGLFSNESGLGSAPIVAAAAQTRNPVRQALVSSTGTFWDTVVICALTGLVLVSSILAYPDITFADGAALTKVAFSKIPYVGAPLLAFGILTFAFSTILGWSYYGESAVNYIEGRRTNRFYRILYIVALFFGSIINLDIIWNIADCMNALMAIPNLVALLLLSGVAAQETKKYLWSGRIDEVMEEE